MPRPTVASYNKRLGALRSERTTFMALWRELSDYHLAHRGRFLSSDNNKGYKRNTKQYNNSSHLALRTLASGMMAGITSPARPWFRLAVSDPLLKEDAAVTHWLKRVQDTLYEVFARSNLYNSLHTVYSELGAFGTASMGIFQDFDNVIRCVPYTVGSYLIAANGKDEVDTFYREYRISVAQCVKEFGYENCTIHVQNQWDSGNTEAWVEIVAVIEPNDDRDRLSPLANDKKYRSVYYEVGGTASKENKFLRESGFDDFAVVAPRWDVTHGDIYATDCPGMTALGDTKALQLAERRRYQAIDMTVRPPLQGPAALKRQMQSLRSGDFVATNDPKGARSIYDFRPDIASISAVIEENEQRISRAFYEDLFLMLANSDRRQITAREVAEKHEEKLLMLGPVLERLHSELLDPLIDRTFNILQAAGVLPVPPEALQNSVLKVEYVSVLAQAQQLVSLSALERTAEFAGNLSAIWPDARHKVDPLQMIDEYANALGVTPAVVNSDDIVGQMVQAEREAQAQAQAMEQANQLAATAKTASEVDVTGDNAVAGMMRDAGIA